MEPLILASASPRRQDFFRLLGLPFVCVPAETDETPNPGLCTGDAIGDIAKRKISAVAAKPAVVSYRWIFAADTVVVHSGEMLGKPGNRSLAGEMLMRLSGQKHEVVTAMALFDRESGKTDVRPAVCQVEFAPLCRAEIEWYLDTGEWHGAAGAYRIQEKGACFVKSVTGQPSTVAGLPLRDFYVMLRENGYYLGDKPVT